MLDIKNETVKLLTENARYTDSQIAKMLGTTEATVKETVDLLEKEGIIVKYSAIINTEVAAEKTVEALIEVKVAPQKLKGFDSYAEEIYNFKEVKSLYLMSGGFDLAIFVSGEGLADISRFIAEKLSVIDGITSVSTHFVLKKYKIEGQVTVPQKDKRQMYQA